MPLASSAIPCIPLSIIEQATEPALVPVANVDDPLLGSGYRIEQVALSYCLMGNHYF